MSILEYQVPRIDFPASKLDLLNKTPADSFVHSNPEEEERVVGFLDVFHQLHCLVRFRGPMSPANILTHLRI